VRFTVPAGWSAPSATGSDPGYVIASKGTVTVSNRMIIVSDLTLSGGQTVNIVYGSRASTGSGASVTSTPGNQAWPAIERSTSAGTVTALAASPAIRVYAHDGSGTLTASPASVAHGSTGKTITLTYTAASGGVSGASVTIVVPSGWSAPSGTGTAPGFVHVSTGAATISGRTITVSGVTLAGTAKLTVQYGSRASSGPGATAPATAVGAQTWTSKERSVPAGVLTALTTSPRVTIS
jgi:hypothetical protein